MKKFVIAVVIFICLLVCCNDPYVKVSVQNSSESIVDSIIISNGIDNLKFENLKPGKTKIKNLYFSNQVKSDGGYSVRVFKKNETTVKGFGYYSNGLPLWDYLCIKINKDTIIATEEDASSKCIK
jgi:hypothetical protein